MLILKTNKNRPIESHELECGDSWPVSFDLERISSPGGCFWKVICHTIDGHLSIIPLNEVAHHSIAQIVYEEVLDSDRVVVWANSNTQSGTHCIARPSIAAPNIVSLEGRLVVKSLAKVAYDEVLIDLSPFESPDLSFYQFLPACVFDDHFMGESRYCGTFGDSYLGTGAQLRQTQHKNDGQENFCHWLNYLMIKSLELLQHLMVSQISFWEITGSHLISIADVCFGRRQTRFFFRCYWTKYYVVLGYF